MKFVKYLFFSTLLSAGWFAFSYYRLFHGDLPLKMPPAAILANLQKLSITGARPNPEPGADTEAAEPAARPTKTSAEALLETTLDREKINGADLVFAGVDLQDNVVLVDKARIFVRGAWYPARVKREPAQVIFQSTAGDFTVGKRGGKSDLQFNRESVYDWPTFQYRGNLPHQKN